MIQPGSGAVHSRLSDRKVQHMADTWKDDEQRQVVPRLDLTKAAGTPKYLHSASDSMEQHASIKKSPQDQVSGFLGSHQFVS